MVDVEDYDQEHINGRYGVLYFKFGVMGFISFEGGGKQVKRTSSMRAKCDKELKVVFSWSGTTTLEVQPPMECLVDGQWTTLYVRSINLMTEYIKPISNFDGYGSACPPHQEEKYVGVYS
ncbi:hypothetical protein FEM48_Zijuj06G0210800 [Ziziphus jujuba var. spinosa]|uniref:Uncharacterized protein n=1 Tax=Ziziphus jujuba var. spinosa TaxID=714518 RepID=A0A978VBM0_ZIZJJ|nr:hypothetical protein FEM48_Zijuj06G0210800 [Ziziphus jujuba var. spinosa]